MSDEKKKVVEASAAVPEKSLNETIKEAITAGMVAVTQLQRNGMDPNTPLVAKTKNQVNYSIECPECFQPALACKGKHVKIAVWPSKYVKGFRGVAINGHWYLSTFPGQLITVPEEAADTIKVHINKYVKAEETMRESRSWDLHNNGGFKPVNG
jgi:hypothetical protein